MTFTDEDVKSLQGFTEFVRDHATFEMSWDESTQLTRYAQFMRQHIKSVYDNVVELKQVIEQPKPKKSSSKRKK